MSLGDAAAGGPGKAANARFQKTVTKPGTQQNKGVQSFTSPYLAPTPPGQLQKIAQKQVQSQVAPTIKQLNSLFAKQLATLNAQYDRQRTQGVSDISGANAGFVKGAGQYTGQMNAANDEAIHGQQLLDDGINQFLKETGQHAQSDTAGALTGAGAPAAMQASAQSQLGGVASGVQGAALAQGAGTLSRMMSQKAADENYGNLLPNIARQMGEQDTSLFTRGVQNARSDALSNLSNQRSTALGDITSKVPGLVSAAYQNLYKTEVQKAELQQANQLDLQKAQAGVGTHLQNIHRTNADGSITYGTFNPATGQKVWDQGSFPGAPGAAGSPKFGTNDKIYKDALKIGQDLHKNMMKTLNGYATVGQNGQVIQIPGLASKTPNDHAKRQKVVAAVRKNAVSEISQAVSAGHPEYSQHDVAVATAQVLTQAGFPLGAQQVLTQAGVVKAGKPPKTGGGAGAGAGGKGAQTKTAPAQPKAPTYPTGENVGTKAQQTAADIAKKKAQTAAGAQGVAVAASKDVESRLKLGIGGSGGQPGGFTTNNIPYATNVARVAHYITNKYKTVSQEQARQIARSALAPYYRK